MGYLRTFFLSALLVFAYLTGFKSEGLQAAQPVNTSSYPRIPTIAQSQTLTPASRDSASHSLERIRQRIIQETDKATNALMSLSSDPVHQSRAALWQSSVREEMQAPLGHSNPQMALINYWYYIKKIDNYFKSNVGKNAFGRYHYVAVGTTQNLDKRIDNIAKKMLTEQEYKRVYNLVDYHAKLRPFHTTRFILTRLSANQISTWQDPSTKKASSQPKKRANPQPRKNSPPPAKSAPLIEGPEQLMSSDTGDSAPRYSVQQMPLKPVTQPNTKDSRKDAQLINVDSSFFAQQDGAQNAGQSQYEQVSLRLLHESIQKVDANLQLLSTTQLEVKEAMIQLGNKLNPLAESIDRQTEQMKQNMADERANTDAIIKRERIAFGTLLNAERNNLLDGLQKTGKITPPETTTKQDHFAQFWYGAIKRLPNMTFYIIVLLCILFSLPFFIGYTIGKKRREPNFTIIKTEKESKSKLNKPFS
ncbi:MAG: hypothetical protein ACRCWB_02745 [Enterovibrio sp.]